jgi:hypothetical protein
VTAAPTIKKALDTIEPTMSPTTSQPTRALTTLKPTSSPRTSPPTSERTDKPSIPLATDVPSNVPTSTKTLVPSSYPSIVRSDKPSIPLATDVPSNIPTLTETLVPSSYPSIVRSDHPSLTPTEVPRTDKPSIALATDVPSNVPTLTKTLVPSSYPSIVRSDHPSLTPTEVPSVSALSASFFTLSDNRRTEDLVSKLSSLSREHGEWLIHLGNWNNKNPDWCTRRMYNHTATLYSNSPVPVFFVPGKLEWNHCPDYDVSTAMWREYFVGYDEKYWDMSWSKRGYKVTRQPGREENFAFDYKNSVYIGLNMVSGKVWDEKDWDDRLSANLQWVKENVEKNLSADLIVMFGNAGPIKNNLPFFDELTKSIQGWTVDHRNLNFLYVKQNSSPLDVNQNFRGLDNFFMLNVESDQWPPTKISLDTNRYTMIFDDGEWYNQ